MSTITNITRAVVVLLTTAAWADAQPATDQFSRLTDYLRLGDSVILSDAAGRNFTGTLQALRPESMDVQVAGNPRTVLAGDVSRVRLRKPDSLGNGTLIGAGVGAGIGALWGYGLRGDGNEIVNTVGLLGVICGAVGTGIGAAIDSAIPTHVVVYRRPRGAGIAMSMRF